MNVFHSKNQQNYHKIIDLAQICFILQYAVPMKRLNQLIFSCLLSLLLSGCFLTKVATVPMRVVGSVISVVPVVGNTADAVIDSAADVIDEIPL